MIRTVLICVCSADCGYIVGSSADCKDVSEALGASCAIGVRCCVRIGNSKVDEVQSMNTENILNIQFLNLF